MKKSEAFKLGLCSVLFFVSIQISFAKSGDGWSSSGGGEYIVDQDNPWFLGKESIKWCINHGGKDNFSLDLASSKIEIEKGILRMLNQIQSINNSKTNLFFNPKVSKMYPRKNYIIKYKRAEGVRWHLSDEPSNSSIMNLLMSDTLEYVENCENAELEIILGNINDEKIKKLIEDLGVHQFRRMAGVAMRTSYSNETLRGKGFIYIAADSGDFKYSGEKAVYFSKNDQFWSFHEKISDKAAMPPGVYPTIYNFDLNSKVERKFKESIVSTLQGVIAHEFGHVLGLKHNKSADIMDVDYPAEVIKNGVIFIGNFIRDASVISDSMIEENVDRRIVFEHETCTFSGRCIEVNLEKAYKDLNSQLAKMLGKALFSEKELGSMGIQEGIYSLFYVFDGIFDKSLDPIDYDDKIMNYPYSGDFKILAIHPITLKYVERIKYPVKFAFCDFNSVYQSITVRVENKYIGIFSYKLDEVSQEWIKAEKRDYVQIETLNLLTLSNRNICGEIDLGFRKKMNFEILINSAIKQYEILFYSIDSKDSNPVKIQVSKSHFANTFKYGMPDPRPKYYFVDPEQR